MTRRYARWVALTLLLAVLGGCGGNRPVAEPTAAIRATREFDKGEGFKKREDWDTAIACYTEAIRLKPDFAKAFFSRGLAYKHNGESDKSIKDYTEAIRLKPDYVDAYHNRGLAYGKKGEYDKAIKDCTQAIRLKPDYAYAFNNRGLAYRKKGETNKAIKDLSEAIRLKPDDALAYYNRGLAYEERGETNKAIKDYTEAIRLDPDSEWSNDLERKAKSKAALPNRSDLSTITNPDEKAAALAFKAAGANLFLTNGTVTDIGFLGGGCDDALAANLAKTPYVERLTLLGCPKVTDKSVAAISGLKKLKMAMLIGTGISAVGAKKIQRAVGRGGMVMHPATQRSMMKALGGGGPGGQ